MKALTLLLIFIDCFQQIKTFSYWVSGLMASSWMKLGHIAFATEVFAIAGHVTGGLSGHGSSGSWEDWTASRILVNRPGIETRFCFRLPFWVHRWWACYQLWLSLGPWEVSPWATELASVNQNCSWTVIERGTKIENDLKALSWDWALEGWDECASSETGLLSDQKWVGRDLSFRIFWGTKVGKFTF